MSEILEYEVGFLTAKQRHLIRKYQNGAKKYKHAFYTSPGDTNRISKLTIRKILKETGIIRYVTDLMFFTKTRNVDK